MDLRLAKMVAVSDQVSAADNAQLTAVGWLLRKKGHGDPNRV
jgi:hypothetical protein